MTYLDSETSTHGGKPVELYRYEGTYTSFYYTSASVPIDYNAGDGNKTYTPIAMKRTAITQTTQADDDANITIDLPVSIPLVLVYGFQIAPPDLRLTIYRGHEAGEFVQFWQGNVDNISIVRGTATIRVPSDLASALAADFPNVFFQTPCNHTLFDAQCKVSRAAWSFDTTIVSVDGRSIVVTDIGTLDGQLVGGELLLPSGERRMITAQSGNALTVNYPFAGAEVAGDVEIAAGCDLAWKGDCKTRFNNTINFGGFPTIPSLNVFTSGVEPPYSVDDRSINCNPCQPVSPFWQFRLVNTPELNSDGEPTGQVGNGTGPYIFLGGGLWSASSFPCGTPPAERTYLWDDVPEYLSEGDPVVEPGVDNLWDCRYIMQDYQTTCPNVGARTSLFYLWCKGPYWTQWRLAQPRVDLSSGQWIDSVYSADDGRAIKWTARAEGAFLDWGNSTLRWNIWADSNNAGWLE